MSILFILSNIFELQALVIPTKPVLDLIGEWESIISGYFGASGFPLPLE